MNKILSFILVLFCTIHSVLGQEEDSVNFAPLEVVVTNFNNEPQKGENIIFEGINSDLIYSGITNAEGKFNISIKGGETYLIKIKSIGNDKDYSKFEIPKLTEGNLYSKSTLTVKFELPKTFTLDNVQFESGETALSKSSYEELNELLEYLNLKEDLLIEIAGHTDNVGEDEYNIKLSEGRAKKVKDYLVSKGISPERIVAKGYGETQAIATNDSPEGRKMNRRTEVRIISE